ncbi:Viral movement protein [Heracleum sosnowskyi]|uniref:Viral movement protein n=1 Tax=Heracleum sosnowskyi TaxID=360622 RepID=A0AAD8H7K4_9APIA|nr:Viral movement protein [Heracleum sosnowskyi]
MASPKHLTPSPSFSSSRNSFSSSKSKNNDFLYAVDYHKDDSKIPITELPLLNPYRTFTKRHYQVSRAVKQVFSPSRKIEAKELVLASKLEQVPIPSTEAEQIFPIQLEDSLPAQWHAHGYSHLHFGAVRMALTLHGRKGLPVVARMALLDTRFEQYAHACIATVQTTLNAGTVFITSNGCEECFSEWGIGRGGVCKSTSWF